MSADDHRPASTPDEPPRWEQRLGRVLPWYVFVILCSVLLATGSLPIRLTQALQQLANIAVAAEFVVFLPTGFFLVMGAMRRNPAASLAGTWGRWLLVTGCFGAGVLLAYGFITGLLPEWHRANTEILVLVGLGSVFCTLVGLGLVLVVVALIGEIRQFWRSRYHRPPANSGR